MGFEPWPPGCRTQHWKDKSQPALLCGDGRRRRAKGWGPLPAASGLSLTWVWGISRLGPSWSPRPRPPPAAPRPSPGQGSWGFPGGAPRDSESRLKVSAHRPTSPHHSPQEVPRKAGGPGSQTLHGPGHHAQLPLPSCPGGAMAPISPLRKLRLRERHHLHRQSGRVELSLSPGLQVEALL